MRARSLLVEAARHRRWLVVGTLGAYLVVYLLAIQKLVVARSLRSDLPAVELVADPLSRAFDPIAPFYFEPVAAVYLTERLTLLVSPLNLAMGLVLGGLVGLNLGVAVHAYRQVRACRSRAVGGLLGALPGFLTGFACCVPTLALVLGAQLSLAVIALRSWFFPVAVAALVGSLVWNLRTLARHRLDVSAPPGVPVG